MDRKKIIEKLQKLKVLSEKGIGGERSGAKFKYEKLKSKYGITEQDLQEEPQDQQEKPFDGYKLFQAATAATMLNAEQQECDVCPGHYGQKECEECGTYENIRKLCLQLEKLSRQRKERWQHT